MKLGKKPATRDVRDITLDQIRLSGVPEVQVPRNFGRTWMIANDAWGMLGNDRYGDCVWAGAAHETMLYNVEGDASVLVPFTDEAVLSDYASTGFDPQTGANDNGTDVRQALGYRLHTGIVDGKGVRHKIGAYVRLEVGNWDQLLEACYVFTAVGIGFQFPDYAMDQFNAGKAWSYDGQGTIEGGHYVPVTGHPALNVVKCITWGRPQLMTRRFYETYCDEAWAILSPEALRKGVLRGYNISQLQQLLEAL